MLMYAANIYLWRRYRVNYSFIFGFKQGTEMDHRQVLLVSFGIAVLALISVILNLDMEMDPKTNDYKQLTELLPLNLLIVRSILFSASFNFIISKRFRNPSFFFSPFLCSFYLSYCSCHSMFYIAQLASSYSPVSFIVLQLLSTR